MQSKTFTPLKKKLLGISLTVVFGVLGFFYFTQTPNSQDPLHHFFSFHPNSTADFITDSVHSFSGTKSETINQCIANAPVSSNKGEVFALINNEQVIEMLREKQENTSFIQSIQTSISPVLGHAHSNSQINWRWKEYISDTLKIQSGDTQYVFKTFPGEEPLWYCYFSQENSFFTQLFYPQSVTYQTHADDFSVSVNEPITGNTVTGNAPWGSKVIIETENGQRCETWANSSNEFSCTFGENFVSGEIITTSILTPNETPYSIILREGNIQSLKCKLDTGKMGECQVE